MTKCPFCHFENEDGALFCERCSSDLSSVAVPAKAPPPPPPPPPAAMAIPMTMPATMAEPIPVAVAEALPMAAFDPAPMAMAVPLPVAAYEPLPVAAYEPLPVAAYDPLPVAAFEPLPADPMPLAAPIPAMELSPPPAPLEPVAAPAPPPAPMPMPAPMPAHAPLAGVDAKTGAALPAGSQPRLQVLRGQKRNVEYPVFPGFNYVGRADDKPVDIDLEEQEPPDRVWCSRQHAVLNLDNDVLTLEDLNSANGTYVNRTRVYPGQPKALAVNDVIQIGNVQMKVVI